MLVAGPIGSACGRAPEPPPPPPRIEEGARLRWPGGLPHLIATSSTSTVPSPPPGAYREASEHWRTATAAFARRDVKSADAFLAAAERLRAGPPEHAGAFRAGRCMAYENAGAVWRGAGLDDAADRLRALATADPACARSVERALQRLQQPQTETSTASSSTAASR